MFRAGKILTEQTNRARKILNQHNSLSKLRRYLQRVRKSLVDTFSHDQAIYNHFNSMFLLLVEPDFVG